MHFWNNFKFDIVLIWQCWYHQFCHIFSFKEMFLYVTSILYLILKPILSNQNLCQPYSVYLHIWNNIWYIIICKIITYFCVYYIYTSSYIAPSFSFPDSEPAFSFLWWQPENMFHFLWTLSDSYYMRKWSNVLQASHLHYMSVSSSVKSWDLT